MKTLGVICCGVMAGTAAVFGADDFLDRIDDALTVAAWHDDLRARLSGTVDLESYPFERPAPGLIFTDGHNLFNPRLTLFLDAQLGSQVYVFAQARADRGFDPHDDGVHLRLDEYAIRLTPWSDGRCNFQLGTFATVVGSWVPRHHAWDNPFITAPLPYENLTGIFDTVAAQSADVLLRWAHAGPAAYRGNEYADKYLRVPIIWGPSYTSGAAVSGAIAKVDYAFELKNASLSSRPEVWDAAHTQWQHPTVSGRVAYRPNEMWNLGFSASTGTYLQPSARPTLAAGHDLDDYRETVLGQDLGFAWHHLQVWAELFETRFEIPRVGHADTFAYYLEVKYKFTPQFFGALRWNRQVFGTVRDSEDGLVRWGRNVGRLDLGPGYRFTPHTQLKLQYSLQHEDDGARHFTHLLAAQFVMRF
jgi:hypothetical protein